MELSNSFEISPFDKLDNDQYLFLTTFLKHRGNLKLLQEELNISYPYAKKKLTELLSALNLTQENDETFIKEDVNMQIQFEGKESNRAGDIVRRKLMENGGRAIVTSISGNRYGIKADADGQHILCNELPPIYTYDVFDVIVDLLKKQPNHRAGKGNARNYRLGEAGCEENTVAGAILKNYFGKSAGESGVDRCLCWPPFWNGLESRIIAGAIWNSPQRIRGDYKLAGATVVLYPVVSLVFSI